MKYSKNVKGSMEVVKDVEFNVDTIYVRSNAKRVQVENFECWEYDEIQYSYQEWADLQYRRTVKLEALQKQQDQLALESLFKLEMLELKK